MHITDGIDMDQGSDSGDNQHHRGGQRIYSQGPIHLQLSDGNPFRQGNSHAFRVRQQGYCQQHSCQE